MVMVQDRKKEELCSGCSGGCSWLFVLFSLFFLSSSSVIILLVVV